MFIGKYARFTQQETIILTTILIRSIDYIISKSYLSHVVKIFHTFVVSRSHISKDDFRILVSIINTSIPKSNDIPLIDFPHKYGLYYRKFYDTTFSNDEIKQAKNKMFDKIDQKAKNEIQWYWLDRIDFIFDKMKDAGVPNIIITDISRYMDTLFNISNIKEHSNIIKFPEIFKSPLERRHN